jgi:uncharacterized protein
MDGMPELIAATDLDYTRFGGLALLGFLTGVISGLFGIGGAFIATPVMIAVLDFDSSLAVGCSMGFTLASAGLGLFKHARYGHLETRVLWLIGLASCVGTWAGYQFHYGFRQQVGPSFPDFVNWLYVAMLVPTGLLILWKAGKNIGHPWLSRFNIPPMVSLHQKGMPPVSQTLLALFGLGLGIIKGLIGIGGGILLVPFLVLAVGMTPQRAASVSLGMTLLSSLVGTALYIREGDFDLLYTAVLFAGSWAGITLGTRWCFSMTPRKAKYLLAGLVLTFSSWLILKLV